jgi:hypothetical protein
MDFLSTLAEFVIGLLGKKPIAEIKVSIPFDGATVEEAPKPDISVREPKSDFILTHTRFCSDGIFGELKKFDGTFVAYTLEHSYDNKPKLTNGNYTCVRGPHKLHGMTNPFITFEIMGVPDFNGVPVTGVLFHWGNYNKDSEGCVLMGASEAPTMIGTSVQTWTAFMASMSGIDSFNLTVQS